MEYTEVKAQTPADLQLEPLVILEDGDEPEDFVHISTRGKVILRVTKPEDDMQEDGDRLKGRSTNGVKEGETVQVDLQIVKEEAGPEGSEMKDREDEAVVRMEERSSRDILKDLRSEPEPELGTKEEARGTTEEGSKTVAKEEPLADAQSKVQLRPKDLLKPEVAHQKVNRLSSDSPDALYELLCALQEGRRLNDQRCSFTLEPRRRCHSVPSALHPGHKVVFSSMTSLQKEEIMDLIAISQARRLDDQRANFKNPVPVSAPEPRRPSSAPAEIPPSRHKSRRSSWKQVMEFGHSAPKPAAKEELYNMILTTQAQGRLEDQRSKAPGPMDDEDFFSLLMKVQGGRMEEQRTELPVALQY